MNDTLYVGLHLKGGTPEAGHPLQSVEWFNTVEIPLGGAVSYQIFATDPADLHALARACTVAAERLELALLPDAAPAAAARCEAVEEGA